MSNLTKAAYLTMLNLNAYGSMISSSKSKLTSIGKGSMKAYRDLLK
jgi:ureidoglycolate hydrolase